MRYLRAVSMAFSMYSRLPMPWVRWSDDCRAWVLCAFPLVGAVLGLLLLAAFTEQEQGRGRQRFLLFLCALLALAIGMLGVGCAAVAAAILVYLWYIQMARREFGGLTGDLAGWFLQVCELGCLAAMVLAREIAEVLI